MDRPIIIKTAPKRHFDFGRRKVGLCSGETSTFLRGKSQFAPRQAVWALSGKMNQQEMLKKFIVIYLRVSINLL
jgi:hypothetical protein